MKDFLVLGINYGGHDTSATLGFWNKKNNNVDILAACEQERYDNQKHSRQFPIDAIKDCLRIAGVSINKIDQIAFGCDYPDLINKMYLEPALKSSEKLDLLINDINQVKILKNIHNLTREKLNFSGAIINFRHHLCHLASAYYASGFKTSLLFSNDGLGEIESSMLGIGNFGKIKNLEYGPKYPDSLGLIYAAITHFLGWKYNYDEGIVMGLAALGDPHRKIKGNKRAIDIFRNIIQHKSGFNYTINKKWIAYHIKRDAWVSDEFKNYFGQKRFENAPIKSIHKDIAAALQLRLEEVVLKILNYAADKYKVNKICIAGGVGLNCSLNGKILKSNIFKNIFVQPASGDSGVSLGAAYLALNKHKSIYNRTAKFTCYLGGGYKKNKILNFLKKKSIKFSVCKGNYSVIANFIKEGKIVGWFQGRQEFGPRALGNRSILCKPFPYKMKDYLNSRVKFRESFRPFAPAVLEEDANKYFHLNQTSPHMLIACKVKNKFKKKIAAAVHVDDTCRVQTVSKFNNLNFYNLINEFKILTGVPVLLNTSFNIKGQTIVNTVEKAYKTFLKTNIDVLVLDDFYIVK